jgi:hypothetical protein
VKSLNCQAVNQQVVSWINQQPSVANKIHSNDEELQSSLHKGPAEHLPIEGQVQLLLSQQGMGQTS